jgi:hypothetical protein
VKHCSFSVSHLLSCVTMTVFVVCIGNVQAGQERSLPKTNRCVPIGIISSASLTVLAEMQATVENGRFYSIPTASAGVKECTIRDDSGVLQLEYKFRNNDWLRVIGDERIEYSMQEVRYTLPSKDDAITILKHELHNWFGGVDCGIDWNNPVVTVAKDDVKAMDTVYWGEVCNCSARIRHDSGNRVIGLRISSVCN